MLITTTPSFATHTIDGYFGPVFGETVYGANVLRDFFAAITDVVGGRSDAYESLLIRGRSAAMSEMADRAVKLGANAVVGMRFDYSTVGNSMLMICCVGTAVNAVPNHDQTGV
ncbi:MAG: YbjQ family protein [Rubripirellula sp.]